MSFVSLVFNLGVTRSMIGAIELDAMTNERIELKSQATKYYVEEGAPISDHVIIENESLSINGVISTASLTLFGEGKSRLIATVDALRQIKDERLPVVITTGLGMYSDMVMEGCTIDRGTPLQEITLSCSFVKIRKARKRTTDVPEVTASGTAKGKAGATKTKAGKVSSKSGVGNDAGQNGNTEISERQKTDLKKILTK
ncbi:phage baseplate protein [Advenella sp. EE-W14]|uniref:phage baseplate protein n=1 Tax=Advenella sp. EE-W14 TaxID=2722705 RepID=UPI00145CC75B|nr:hypothetical protein [Advenella sp. EE-W14]